jgi:hypothetical protein
MLRVTMMLLLTAALLTGCSPDPKATKITPALLENPDQIQKVSNRLEPGDRELFGRYVLGRTLSAKTGFGKPITNAQGKDPATVAEAIEVMKAAAAADARRDALTAERDAKLAELDKKKEALREPMEKSHWAAKETEAYNAVIEEKNAVQKDYETRFEAIK